MDALAFDANAAFRMSQAERNELGRFANEFNNALNPGRKAQQELGKDDFLKLLVAQLAHQDPTNPMQDREFIAQMAQFSSLEQMTNMAADFSRLASMLSGSEASAMLGRGVELVDGERLVQGRVSAVTRDEVPQVLVNGTFYDWNQVRTVFDITEETVD